MSFFRRNEDNGKIGAREPGSGHRLASLTDRPASAAPPQYTLPDINDFEAFGSVIEENQQSSEDLIAGLTVVQERVSSLLGAHSQSLNEVGALRSECARIGSLLDYESGARRKLDQDNFRLAAENKGMQTDNAQLRLEVDAIREEFVKLQSVHEATSEELTAIEMRLRDAERESIDRAGQYDEASTLLKRAQQELDQRSRDLAATREKLELEMTAHQLLIETSRRENGVQTREMARLNEERSQLKSSLTQQENLARSLQTAVTSLKQDVSLYEERHRRLEEEFSSLQSSSALEIAHLTTRHDAIGSKAELVEKLLVTANGRNKMTDEELQTTRTELKRIKSELMGSVVRSERLGEELARARTTGTESEMARRELATLCNDLTGKLREAEGLRNKRDRETEALKRDLDSRMDTDRHEISQLRTSLEIAKSEIRQLRAERSMLTGQLEVARGDRAGHAATAREEELAEQEKRMPPARYTPMIDISGKSLRPSGGAGFGAIGEEFGETADATYRTPAE